MRRSSSERAGEPTAAITEDDGGAVPADSEPGPEPGPESRAQSKAEPKRERARGSTFRALYIRNYRLYAIAQLVSLTGTWMQRVAQDWLVLELTNSGTMLGLLTTLQFGPSILISPLGGVLADRVDKRRLLILTQTLVSACAFVLGLLVLTDQVALWHVIVLAGALGVVTAIDAPGRQSFVIEMVGEKDLPNAVALNSTIFNLGRVLGPGIAGFVIAAVGTGWAFISNGAATLAVVLALMAMRASELRTAPPVARAGGQLRAAVGYVRERPAVWVPMVLAAVVGVFGQSVQLTAALLARQVFGLGADAYGMLTTATAVGACTAAIMAARRSGASSNAQLLFGAFLFGVAEVVSGSIPSFAGTVVALAAVGFCMVSFATAANAAVQLGIEPTMRGRVMALYLVCTIGGGSIGSPIIGWCAETFSPRSAIVGAGLIVMVSSTALAAHLARTGGMSRAMLVQRARTVLPVSRRAD
jgi:MFS family permease